jgi:hypothetical protein
VNAEAARQREALRQQLLLRALWRDAPSGALAGWMRDADVAPGLLAYRANAGAIAERALAAAFPTIAQLIGADSFAALARAHWRAHAPVAGDLARHGATLPAFIEASPSLASEPCLGDCARLDWAVHEAEGAADDAGAPEGLERLQHDDPERLVLRLRPGTALVSSTHPIATIWLAHRSDAHDRFAPVRAAFAAGTREHALVWREGWRARVAAIDDGDAAFVQALLHGVPLSAALAGAHDASGGRFAFDAWLIANLRASRLAGVARVDPQRGG